MRISIKMDDDLDLETQAILIKDSAKAVIKFLNMYTNKEKIKVKWINERYCDVYSKWDKDRIRLRGSLCKVRTT